jgi:hypothetical protein
MTFAVNIAQGGSNNVTFRNRIINGAMMIDQRNAGASVTLATGLATYCLDRWLANKDTAGATVTVQQSATAPTGFVNSALITVSTGASAGASDQNVFQQSIEGFNVADLSWGTASAQPITISFWVRASIAGTYGFSVSNSAANRAYLATYTVSSANTFEYKTITIAGDTTGTWLTNNGLGIRARWDFGSGSSKQGAAGVWGTTLFNTTSAQANIIGTNGATLYITGVQLEAGTTASPFEYRQYGTELALCQRYYAKTYDVATVPATVTNLGVYWSTGTVDGGGNAYMTIRYPVWMRTAPTVTTYSGPSGTSGVWNYERSGGSGTNTTSVDNNTSGGGRIYLGTGASGYAGSLIYGHWVASAEL